MAGEEKSPRSCHISLCQQFNCSPSNHRFPCWLFNTHCCLEELRVTKYLASCQEQVSKKATLSSRANYLQNNAQTEHTVVHEGDDGTAQRRWCLLGSLADRDVGRGQPQTHGVPPGQQMSWVLRASRSEEEGESCSVGATQGLSFADGMQLFLHCTHSRFTLFPSASLQEQAALNEFLYPGES